MILDGNLAGLERQACELAAERMSIADFRKMHRLHDEMATFHMNGTRQEYEHLNHRIPQAIVALAGNETLMQALAARDGASAGAMMLQRDLHVRDTLAA